MKYSRILLTIVLTLFFINILAEDEDKSLIESIQCNQDQFTCKDGSCIRREFYCDGDTDCIDESDETDNCTRLFNCTEPHYHLCANNRCLPADYICDGADDCGDGSDEKNCTEKKCDGFGEIKCHNGKQCISNHTICDRYRDCFDGSDEASCNGTFTRSCDNFTTFECLNGLCVPLSSVCDMTNDCMDGSDELNCTTVTCPNGTYTCEGHDVCILNEHVCDGGGVNCPKNDDEKNCTKWTCAHGYRKCGDGRICIPEGAYCDRFANCQDASDESNESCHGNYSRACTPDEEFECANGVCISSVFFCNGVGRDDCGDGSDEKECASLDCPKGRKKCADKKKCIYEEASCDRHKDCDDGSDEKDCKGKYTRECDKESQFSCANELCVDRKLVCDKEDDCGDGSDEKDCP